MNAFRKWRYGNWFIPVVSGLLILVSFGVEKLFGGSWNVTVGPQWWIDAGEHAHGSGHVFTLANAFMLAAAIVAGYGIVVKARNLLVDPRFGVKRKDSSWRTLLTPPTLCCAPRVSRARRA